MTTPKQRLIEAVKKLLEDSGRQIPIDDYWNGRIDGEIERTDEIIILIEEILPNE